VTELLEREELLERLDAARAEGGRLVFVGGEAGVGKTSLVRAFGARVNAPVRYGSCENLTTPTPLGPFVDVSEDAAAAGEPHQVASALLDRLASPHVVVLEDLHWADQATLDVLRVLGRRMDRTSSLVVGTYREDEVEDDHPLRVVLGELASAPWVSRLSVPRLSLQAVSALAEPHRADAKAIYELTGGNAFYVTEVLAAGGDALPTTVRDAVLARAAGLEAQARQLLDVAALVPARAEVWLLEAVAPQEIEQLDACLASGMLRGNRDSVAFRHELARLAVESAVPPQRRRTLHAAILRALASPPVGSADPSRLAHHAEEAGDAAAVLQYAPGAARRAEAASAHREAFAQYARALRYAGDLERAERAELLAAYAHQAHVVGRFEESIAARGEAIELCRALGNARGEGENLARLIMPLVPVGRNAEAEEASIAAIDVLEKLPPGGELAVAYAAQAYMRMLVRDNYDGVFWGGMAETLAETCGDRDTMSWALNLIGTSYVMAGETERGIEYLLRSIDVAREGGLEYRVASGYSMLGSGLGEMYELERSERYSRAFLDHADEHGNDPSYILAWLACARVYRGDWDEGTALARSVLEGGHGAIGRITALIALGRVRARRGDPGATEVLDEALELSRPGGHLQRLGHVHAARAEAAWLAGHPDRALEEALAAYPLALEKRHIWFAGELAYWQWKAGALDDAPDWIAAPYRSQLDGDPRAAAWRAQGCPYEAARALAEADDDELLLETLTELVALGAGPAAKLVRQTLRERGATVPRGPRQTTRANPAELTSRELDVLRLVAGGLRNVDVAEQLVLSTRTVDHHVSAILRKLEVKTRAEAAAAATRLGLLE
jgi:DNA-binding CsgD family transcriptional regulator